MEKLQSLILSSRPGTYKIAWTALAGSANMIYRYQNGNGTTKLKSSQTGHGGFCVFLLTRSLTIHVQTLIIWCRGGRSLYCADSLIPLLYRQQGLRLPLRLTATADSGLPTICWQ